YLLPEVREGATVAHDLEGPSPQAEVGSCTAAEESLPLGEGVTATVTALTFDNGLGDEQAVVGGLGEDLVGVEIVALTDAFLGARLGREIEAGVHEVLCVGEEELHHAVPLDCT